jgi:CheY-like chemotaxis protein
MEIFQQHESLRERSVPQPGPRAARILVIEDSSSARRVMQELLFGMGATPQNLRLARNSSEALQFAREWPPDLVFLDVELRPETGDGETTGMPEGRGAPRLLNGDDLGKELLEMKPDLPIVVVTALDMENPRVQGLRKRGVVDVIMKPVRAARVQEVLTRLGVQLPSSR